MEVNKIFFDMDFVLADFERGVYELCNLPPNIKSWVENGGTGILHKSAEETVAILKEKGIL